MKYLNWDNIIQLAVPMLEEWSVYINNGLDYDDEAFVWEFIRTQVESKYEDHMGVLSYLVHGGLFSFPTEKGAREFYNIFEQRLTGSSGIYAALYDFQGNCITENT
jgi:hypothetical protein